MVWIGDIDIPILTEKDTSISRDTIEKNFVDSPPQVYELTADLESGTYSAYLHEDLHSRNETFEEQIDSVISLPDRHVTECPISVAGDEGYILIDSVTSTVTPSRELREAEMDLRFFDNDVFRPAIDLLPQRFSDTFLPTPEESIYPLPSSVQNVVDSNGSITPEYTISTEDGDIDLYLYSGDNIFEYDQPSDFASAERVAPVRLYQSLNGQRVYSDEKTIGTGCILENGLLRGEFNDTQANIHYYDGSWGQVGDVNVGAADGYSPENMRETIELSFVDSFNVFEFRGLPVFRFDVDSVTDFTFNGSETLSTGDTSTNWFRTVTDASNREIILIRTSEDGSFYDDGSVLRVENLTSGTEYTFFIGVVPGNIPAADFARYIYCRGTWKETLVQR